MSNVAKRSETIVIDTPRGKVEIVRQEWRSQRPNSAWEWVWLARRKGQVDWRQSANVREAIRQATLVAGGRPPAWLTEAAQKAERDLVP